MNCSRRVLLSFCAGILTGGLVFAEDVSLLRSDTSSTRSFLTAGNWSDAQAPHVDSDYFVTNNYLLLTSAGTFAGRSLALGSGKTSGNLRGWGQCTLTIADCHFYRGLIDCNNEGWLNFDGCLTIHQTSAARNFAGINQNVDGGRNIGFIGTLKSAEGETPVITVYASPNVDDKYTTIRFAGDMTDWHGKIVAKNKGTFVLLDSATACSGFTTLTPDALTLQANAKLVINSSKTVQSPNWGVTIASGVNAYLGTITKSANGQNSPSCRGGVETIYPDYDLLLPIAGTATSTFVKNDKGRIKLRNDWSGFSGTLAIEGGSLVLTDDMTGTSNLKISVRAGGALETERADGTYGGIDVTFEAGAGLVVPYNPETGVASPITLGASFLSSCTFPVGLSLSSPVNFPINETNALAVAHVDSAHRVVTGADFQNNTTKNNNLPVTWFEVETDADGMQTVYLMMKPVLVREDAVGQFSILDAIHTLTNKVESEGYVWSDHQAPHPGADYINSTVFATYYTWGGVGSRREFRGDSLVWTDGLELDLRTQYTYFENLIPSKSGLRIYPIGYAAMSRHVLEGNIQVSPLLTSDSPLHIFANTDNGRKNIYTVELAASLNGTGHVNFKANANSPNDAYITTPQTNFTGCILLQADGTSATVDGLTLHITDPRQLGAPRSAISTYDLYLRNRCFVRPECTMTFNTPNRQVTISSDAGFDVPTNVVFTLASTAFAQAANLIKKGEGALVCSWNWTASKTLGFGEWNGNPPNGTNNVILVREGGIVTGVMKSTWYHGFKFTGTGGIAVFQTPPTAFAEENGLYSEYTGVNALMYDEKIPVKFYGDEDNPPQTTFTRVICTWAQDLDASVFAPEKPATGGAWACSVTKEQVGSLWRYSVTYRPQGMMILFR